MRANKSYAVAAVIGIITGIALNLPVIACCFCFLLPLAPIFIGVFDSMINKYGPTQSNAAFISALKAGAIGGVALSVFMALTGLVKLALGITIDLSQSLKEFDFDTKAYSWITGIFGILICSSVILIYFVLASGVSGLVTASLSKSKPA